MELKTIHEDDRGKIYLLLGDLTSHEEITIFKTYEGYARGGCIHPESNEHCCIMEGEVEYIVGDKKIQCKKGDTVFIPKNTPHYYISKKESLVMEWGATPEEKKNKHIETRKIVVNINNEEL
jgi:mannose-6-phosphate isomerase-like protein (cupin superfamily)